MSGHIDAQMWTEGFTHGDVVKGMRFARNRVHHQGADALWSSHRSERTSLGARLSAA